MKQEERKKSHLRGDLYVNEDLWIGRLEPIQ